ncbi:hypothetical protein OHD16_26180 [Sphingobacterium sp. ML3W]|uniref:cytidylyltransferase domain-containing protein n=1 Tax=Sphingobacterium sp. ML3W TaxID=1538644 RepID=UPI00249B0D20|nr:hypothetical protein [Sphingobacterium sp. ML3W]WFA78195.1 hypothetical protein OGI71_19320 [Sphingobacterium sp. ML3W]
MDKQVVNIGYIIQARMKSERLPGKVLLPLPFPSGRSVLEMIVVALSNLEGKIIIATSINSENDVIEEFCFSKKIECFRGDESNVLSRFLNIQKKFKFDHIVRLTADNPFIDFNIIAKAINFHCAEGNDYTHTVGLPLGMNIEVMKGNSLIDSEQYILNDSDTEHVTLILKREAKYSKGNYLIEGKLEECRLTVDTPQDFMVANILAEIQNNLGFQGLELVYYVKKNYPWILEGNSNMFQKNSEQNLDNEVKSAIRLLEKLEYNKTSDILRNALN